MTLTPALPCAPAYPQTRSPPVPYSLVLSAEIRLQYPMRPSEALRRGLLFGAAFAAAPLLRGHVWQGLAVFLALGTGMFIAAHRLLKTTVHALGFNHHGWRHVEWADVADAAIEQGDLRLTLRGGERETLPAFVLADARFADALQTWLATEHPVRRAIEGQRSAPS